MKIFASIFKYNPRVSVIQWSGTSTTGPYCSHNNREYFTVEFRILVFTFTKEMFYCEDCKRIFDPKEEK